MLTTKTTKTTKFECIVLKELCDFNGKVHKIDSVVKFIKKDLDYFKKVNAIKEV